MTPVDSPQPPRTPGAPGRARITARVAILGLAALTSLALAASPASAHDEREITFPDGTGQVPQPRTGGPQLLVCKSDRGDFEQRISEFEPPLRERNLDLFDQCQQEGHRHLQEAIDAATDGTTILVLPGTYREEPSLEATSAGCDGFEAPTGGGQEQYRILTFEQQVACPHEQNLVAILGRRDLQIEGTGAAPTDVVVDAEYRKLNTIRADRADGLQLRNLTAQRSTFNAVYVLETDGFAIDSVLTRWNVEYGFLLFANDHGRLSNCEGYGNGDAAIYPGSASNINADAGHEVERYAVEITGCYGHHNLLGYSGTAGNSVWAHDNVFTENGAGVAMDSAFPDHPGMPQNHALFEQNVIGDNNQDYYRYVRDGTCALPVEERGYEDGVVCPVVGLPRGTGVINPGGNYNIFRENWVYGHDYAGFVTSWVPGFVRGDTGIGAQFDTSHHNRYLDNQLGRTPDGAERPNRLDFWWDGQGRGSCWDREQGSRPLRTEPLSMPQCGADQFPAGPPVGRFVSEPAKLLKLYVCAEYSMAEQRIPGSCDWYGASGLGRVEVIGALTEASLLGLVLLAGWVVRLRRSRLAFGSLLAALAGLVLGVLGAGYEATPLAPLGLALFGIGVLGYGLAMRAAGHAGFGWLTVALAVTALLGAVDRGLVMIPYLSVPPSVLRILLELVWFPWAVGLLLRHRRSSPVPAGPGSVPDRSGQAQPQPS